jgi:soluble lytic murein transglycosylase-like protein
MQLMPETAQQMGVRTTFDPNDNVRGGTRYFSERVTRFNADIELALAAYNVGPGAIEKYQAIPPYKETQKHVRRVLDYYESYMPCSHNKV